MILGSIKMVQIIEMPRKRSIGEAIGQGLGEGFSRGVDAALQDISYEKRLSIQARQQMMLEEQREAKQDQKIWKAANVMAFSKGYPDTAAALFSMEKASPGFLAKVNDQWAPNDWVRLDEHLRQYSSDDQINRSQGDGAANPPPLAQTGGAQVVGAQNARSAIQSTNINPRDPLINQQQMTQPGPNMMPPNPFPDVNRARTAQAMAPQQQPIQEQTAPQGQQRAPIAPVGPATPPEETPYDQMTFKQKVAYNNENYPRKRAIEMNKQALEEEKLREAVRKRKNQEKSMYFKQDQKFLEESRKSFQSAELAQDSLSNMATIRESGNIGVGSKLRGLYSPEVRAARAAYDTHASNLINFYKSLFPRGITQAEFKRISNDWLPNSKFSDATNEAREKAFGEMIAHALRKKDVILSMQGKEGTYPANIGHLVEKQMSDEEKYLKEKLKNPIVEHKVGEVLQDLPDPREMKGVTIEDDKGNELVSNGSTWKIKKK